MSIDQSFEDGRAFQSLVLQVTSLFEFIRDSRYRDELRGTLIPIAEGAMRRIQSLSDKYKQINPQELKKLYSMYSSIRSEERMIEYLSFLEQQRAAVIGTNSSG